MIRVCAVEVLVGQALGDLVRRHLVKELVSDGLGARGLPDLRLGLKELVSDGLGAKGLPDLRLGLEELVSDGLWPRVSPRSQWLHYLCYHD